MAVSVWITGFGSFGGSGGVELVRDNPSRAIAFELEREPPQGVVCRAREIPVTFRGAPDAIDAWLSSAREVPDALLGLGVQSAGGPFRLERRARGTLTNRRPDNDGATQVFESRTAEPDRATTLDLEPFARALRDAGAGEVRLSDDAGAYVCERAYHKLLEWGERLDRPALFLHLPRLEAVGLQRQTAIVRAMVGEFARR